MILSKRLTIREMWKLYQTVKLGLPEKEQKYLIDEVIFILKNIEPPEFTDSLIIMYGSKIKKIKNNAEHSVLFLKGLKQSGFFEFVSFIKDFSK